MNYQTPNYHHCNDNAPECCVPKVRSLCSCRIAVAANVKGDCGSGQCSAPWPALMAASSRGRGHACTSCPGRGLGGEGCQSRPGASCPECWGVRMWGCDEVMRWDPQPGTKVRPWVSAGGWLLLRGPEPCTATGHCSYRTPATLPDPDPEPMINNIWENRQPRQSPGEKRESFNI